MAPSQQDDIRQAVGPIANQIQTARREEYGRIYAPTPEEVVQDTTVIISTLLIHSTTIVVLFDFGNTHTFLALVFNNRIGIPMDDLGHNLVVSTTAGATLTTRVCVRGVPECCHSVLHAAMDFVVLSMREFDTIFGMNWMMSHKVLIDCTKKKVHVCLSHHERLTFQGRGRGSGGSFITF